MVVHFKVTYFMMGWTDFKTDMESVVLTVPSENGNEITVNIFPNKSKIESFHELSISTELLESLKKKEFDYRVLTSEGNIVNTKVIGRVPITNEICNELGNIIYSITKSTMDTINLFKYCLRIYQIGTKIKNIYVSWSFDKSNWQMIQFCKSIAPCPILLYDINENRVEYVQDCLTNGFKHFLAFNYLHEALEEQDSNLKVINAAIAAELAIKEYLIRIRPDIKIILFEVPSPPLDKLYGKILTEYTGKKYDRVGKLQKLIKDRNEIIHRPEYKKLTESEVYHHIIEVEFAIYYLLDLFYPNDQFIMAHSKTLNKILPPIKCSK